MKLDRLAHEPAALVDFYQESLEHLGALCERTWFDRLQVVADGSVARIWNPDGRLHEVELHFPAPDSVVPRDADREVFPGCPLTFQLTEALRPLPLSLERVVLAAEARSHPPASAVAEKLWRAQHPETARWRLETPFVPAHHFSLVVLVRCEIQAVDQHWSLRRVAVSLPDGVHDQDLAGSFHFARAEPAEEVVDWPALDPGRCRELLATVMAGEMATDLAAIRTRQESHLRRELDRVDTYFENYERELQERARRTRNENTRLKADQRLAAARAEHERRRADQIQRHEIRVLPHFDALLLVAEPAWRATVAVTSHNQTQSATAHFIPRSRRWSQEPRQPR
jgi:hypothetical protein